MDTFTGRAVVSELPAGLSKPEFFGADMYMFRVAGFRPGRGVITEPVKPASGARLDVWRTDPRDRRPEIFGGVNTLHFGAGTAPFLLLPIIPASSA